MGRFSPGARDILKGMLAIVLAANVGACSSVSKDRDSLDAGTEVPDAGNLVVPDGGVDAGPDGGADAGGVELSGCNPVTGLNAAVEACSASSPCTRPLGDGDPIVTSAPAATEVACKTTYASPNVWSSSRPFFDDGIPIERAGGQGVNRLACLFRPTASSSSRRPLLVYFHGSGDVATSVYDYTLLRQKAVDADLTGDPARPGFFLLAIQGRNLHWPGHRPEDGTKHDYLFRDLRSPSTNPDIATADGFIDELVGEGGIDPKRIYVTGWSNGAQFAQMYAIARHETATPGGNHVAAAAVYSGGDPFGNTMTDQIPSCQLATYPRSAVPVLMVSRACDLHPCDPAQQAALDAEGLDAPPGATVSTWMEDLVRKVGDPHGVWEILSGTGAVVTSCTQPTSCTNTIALTNHIRWPDGMAAGDFGRDHEPEMLRFLRDHPLP